MIIKTYIFRALQFSILIPFVLLLILAWHFRGNYRVGDFLFLKAVIQFHGRCNYLHQRDVDYYTWEISVKGWLGQQDFFFNWEVIKVIGTAIWWRPAFFCRFAFTFVFWTWNRIFFPQRGKAAILHAFPLMRSCSVWTIKPKINKAYFYLGAQSSQTPNT